MTFIILENILCIIDKEEWNGGTVDWPPNIQTTNLVGPFLAEFRQLDTHKCNFHFTYLKDIWYILPLFSSFTSFFLEYRYVIMRLFEIFWPYCDAQYLPRGQQNYCWVSASILCTKFVCIFVEQCSSADMKEIQNLWAETLTMSRFLKALLGLV